MDRADIQELHYIAAIVNIPSIIQRGIVCHTAAERLSSGHVSVASVEVQSRRASRRIPGGLRLHEYVNLYLNARNAMLFRLLNNHDLEHRVPAKDLAVLRVDPTVLDLPGVVITDINAAADVEPRWHSVPEGLPALDRAEIHAQSWNHSDPTQKRRHMQRMMAEVLVPHRVQPRHIAGCYVVSAEVAHALTHLTPTLLTEVRPYVFFRGEAP